MAAGVVVLTIALHALVAWRQWTAFIVPSWDLAIFSQMAQAYARWEAPIVPIKGIDYNLLGDHFHPILVLLGPVWAAWPSGLALLVVQAFLLGVSAWPLTTLAVERQPRWGAAFGVIYGASWGLQAAMAAQFHEVAFGVPLLAFALAAVLRGRPGAAALWAAPLVFVKEDLGLTVAVFGILIAWRFRRWWGLLLTGWGLAWTALAVTVILPALNPADQYDYAGNLTDLSTFFTPGTKWITAAMLVATAGVIGLRSPLMLLMVPTLLWRFAGGVEHYWGWEWHYNAVLMPVAAAALLDATSRSARHWPPWGALALAGLTTLSLGASLPFAGLVQPGGTDPAWRDAAHRVLAAIPEGARVESDLTLLAYLVPTAYVSWAGSASTMPEFVVIDTASPSWGGTPPRDAAAWATERWGTPFEMVLSDASFQLAARR